MLYLAQYCQLPKHAFIRELVISTNHALCYKLNGLILVVPFKLTEVGCSGKSRNLDLHEIHFNSQLNFRLSFDTKSSIKRHELHNQLTPSIQNPILSSISAFFSNLNLIKTLSKI